jgi:peptidoglycan/LPS O-acetylase OafA/YrhL
VGTEIGAIVSSASRNAPLDSVRGLAAVGVFVFHASNRIGETYGTPYRFLGHLDVGVRVFFALSGYFIYRPFVRAHLRDGSGLDLVEYSWKRFWRIYPAYWIALAFAVVVGYATIEGISGVWKHGLLVQDYFEDEGGTGIRESWTLVVEVALYVLVPVFALAVRLLGRVFGRVRAEFVGVGAVLFGAAIALPAYVDARGFFEEPGLGRVLEPALLAVGGGMMLAVIESVEWSSRTRERIERVAEPAGRWWVAAALVMALLVGWLTDGFESPTDHNASTEGWIHYQWGHALIALLLVVPLVLAPNGGGALRRWLSLRVFVFVGVISFSFYLWHIRVLTVVRDLGGFEHGLIGAIVAGAAALIGALFVGWLGHRFIEQPCAKAAAVDVSRVIRRVDA